MKVLRIDVSAPPSLSLKSEMVFSDGEQKEHVVQPVNVMLLLNARKEPVLFSTVVGPWNSPYESRKLITPDKLAEFSKISKGPLLTTAAPSAYIAAPVRALLLIRTIPFPTKRAEVPLLISVDFS